MDDQKLLMWRERLGTNEAAYSDELAKMDHREDMYRGIYKFRNFVSRTDPHTMNEVQYVYNALAENIEAQVSADIPMPKVTARRPQDEHLAVIIENMLRNELDRLPMENVNDLAERIIPLQGGGLYLLEWDNSKRSHGTVGENVISFLHPKWCIPQNGVYDSVQDMDYVILKMPQTKESIRARYGVDVTDERESEPDLKDSEGGESAEDMVTQYVAYYRNDHGGIGKYSWCNDTELEDMEDCQARHLCRCAQCGAVEPMEGELIADGDQDPYEYHAGGACPVCGARDWTDSEEDFEEVQGPVFRTDGSIVPGTEGEPVAEMALPSVRGQALSPTSRGGSVTDGQSPDWPGEAALVMTVPGMLKIPYYRPDIYPLVLQKNVSVFGRFLGESDADKMEPLQDGINRLEQKIFDRMLKAGSRITLPDDVPVRVDPNDQEIMRIGSRTDLNLIRMFDFTGDVSQEMAQVSQIYEHMRQTIGITDSYQGRRDNTATSGTAKEFAAAQAAGRLESKRIMKRQAYSELFEMMFKFRLAYADEPRPVVYQDGHGDTVYDQFSKWDFLECDEDGHFWWNDLFLFSCDVTAPLASNRERLWQETTSFFSAGAFGDPTKTETLIEYWRKMELLHYPGAGETRKNMQQRLEEEQAQAEQMPSVRGQALSPTSRGGSVTDGQSPDWRGDGQSTDGISDQEIEEMARQQAMADAQGGVSDADIEEMARQQAMNDVISAGTPAGI